MRGWILLAVLLVTPALAADPQPNRYVLIGTSRDGTVFLDIQSIAPGANAHTFQADTLSVDETGFTTVIVNYDCAARTTKSEGLLVFFSGAEFPSASINTSVTSKWEPVFPHTLDDKVLAAVCGRRDLTGDSYPTEAAARTAFAGR